MDDLPHLAAQFRDLIHRLTTHSEVLEERVNRLEKRMCRMEKEGKARNTPRPDKRERRIDRMGSHAV